MSAHIVTGGTGLVGSAIILELLQQTDCEIIALVRPGFEDVEDRLQYAIESAAEAYGYDEQIIREAKMRCRALPGDMNEEFCGIPLSFRRRIDQFWHCAASLRYEDRYKEEIYATNFEGTRHALDLAGRIGISGYFNYISTAYVSGWRSGVISEQLMGENWTNNHYEASKVEAETLVIGTTDFPTRIMRPSVVVGHSSTYAVAQSFTGLYGFMRKLLQFKGAMSRVQEGLLSREALQICADPDALLNFVPVDMVARQAVRIGYASSPARIFHLTNATPPTVGKFLSLLFEELNLCQPRLTSGREDFSWIDRRLDQGITFYSSYLVGSKIFESQNTAAALGKQHEEGFVFDTQTLQEYFHWYLDLLSTTRPRLLAIR